MKQVQRQHLQQRLSPQQIQLMRLLQLPVTDLEQAIKEEVERNPLLDAEPQNEQPLPQEPPQESDWDSNPDDEDYDYNFREHSELDPNDQHRDFSANATLSPYQRLLQQFALLPANDTQRAIATEIIGSLDESGYVARDLSLLSNDLAFRKGIDVSPLEVEQVLHIVQSLDPPGIAARNLQECLLLQLRRLSPDALSVSKSTLDTAISVVSDHFEQFSNHKYHDICIALGISDEQMNDVAALIRHLNPKPGEPNDDDRPPVVTPDIILTQHDGQLQFYLNDSSLPNLSINSFYSDLLASLEQQKGDRSTIQFLRANQTNAQNFIDLLKARHETIVLVMNYIVRHQHRFLLSGNPDLKVPLRQREVAEATGLGISTVSRMANSKYIQTDFGTIPLHECFSKGLATSDGEELAVDAIKNRLANAVASEDKHNPLSDDALATILRDEGMPLARRTVAKYREQLGIPVARLRRILSLLLFLLASLTAHCQMSYYDSIIAARLQACSPQPTHDPPASFASSPGSISKTSKHSHKQSSNRPTPDTTHHPTPILSPIDTTGGSFWYSSFPRHSVNPSRKTQLDLLPDEVNIRLVHDSSDFCFPVRNSKTSNYGWRWNRGHHGVDIQLHTGDPVHAAFAGIVRIASRMGGYGNCIVIRHPNGIETLYGHLSQINVKHGQPVSAGQVIGLGGSTGNSTGPHLHFECRFLYQTFDPEWILDFDSHSLRTHVLHLDKSYFGIHKPRHGHPADYKADSSSVAVSTTKKKSKKRPPSYSPSDF